MVSASTKAALKVVAWFYAMMGAGVGAPVLLVHFAGVSVWSVLLAFLLMLVITWFGTCKMFLAFDS